MEQGDNLIHHIGLDGMLRYKSVFTEIALPSEDYEVHTHYQEFELYRFLEGDLIFAADGRFIKVEAGMVILIANGVLHRPILQNCCRYRRERLLFNKDVFLRFNAKDLELYSKLKNKKIMVLRQETVDREGIATLIDEIAMHLAAQTSYGDFCALIGLFSLLIKVEAEGAQIEGTLSSVRSERVAEMIRYIDEHLSDNLSYKALAERFCLSEKSLYKFFKNEVGFSLGNYISERRILLAQSVLNAGGSAKEAAEAAGFEDYSAFYRCFLKKVGVSPSQYRKM